MKQTLDQKRAAYAWSRVQGCEKDYVTLAKGAGALVMSNGLMATLAFYESKSVTHKKLLSDITFWIFQKEVDFPTAMNVFHKSESKVYRSATQEALDLLRWIRQFAAAVNSNKGE